MVVVASKPSKIGLLAAMIKLPPCEDPSRRTTPAAITKNQRKSDRPEESEKLELERVHAVDTNELVYLLHVCLSRQDGLCLRFSCVLSRSPSVNPTHRHDSFFGNACSLADRDHIIADPLIHFLVLSSSKLWHAHQQ